ncbi:MAG: iron-containing alcohol dehydrogenase [Rhodospirillales bacterium]|nr:iron-containing alcohol dehydrogenase [Rhodospirillales bacterium]
MFPLLSPRLALVGGGSVKDVASVLRRFGLARPLVVTDKFMVASGLVRRCLDPLEAAGMIAPVFSDTVSDPTDTAVAAGVARLRAGDFDCLIGFGGGSSIDTAKAMGLLALGDAPMSAYKVPASPDRAALPVIAIPTTAGTGSEATRVTIVTDTARDEKMLIMGLGCLPLAAIVDYELTLSLPRRITADTGIDSLTHALEAYVSRRANPVTDSWALAAMGLIGANLRTAWHEPGNAAAREAMMLGAMLGGLAFSNASVALVHGMSRPIGAHFHVPHGLSNAMLLPAVTRFSVGGAPERYAAAARGIGLARAEDDAEAACVKLVEGLAALNAALEVPGPRAYGIDADAWEARLEVMAEQALASGSPANNPRVPDQAEIVALYRAVYAANA